MLMFICIFQVVYKADSINLDITDLARNSNSLINVHGDVVFDKCEELVDALPITFSTPEAFITLPKWDASKGGNIEFQFRTNEPNGLLMYNSGMETDSDFFALEILEGYLYLLMDLGDGAIKVKAVEDKVADGLPHIVKLIYRGKNGSIFVDGKEMPFENKGDNEQLDLTDALYVGGINMNSDAYMLPREMWSGMLGYGYVGCFQDLVVNGRRFDMAQISREQEVKDILEYCRAMEQQCVSRPCMHHGVCSEGWNRFICDCSSTGFNGPACNEGRKTHLTYYTS